MDDAAVDMSIAPGPDTPIDTLFFREIADVYLLIDHISAACDKRLPDSIDLDRNGKPDPTGWIDRICEVTWPPKGSRRDVAEQARLLINARDALNRVAAPATGSTIAFTLMVIDHDLAPPPETTSAVAAPPTATETSRPSWLRRHRLIGAPAPSARGRRPVHNSITGLTRYDLATQAFPELEVPARRFARFNRFLILWMIRSLILVLALSWYVAVGNELLRQLHLARVAFQQPETSAATAPRVAAASPPAAAAVSEDAGQQTWSFSCHRYVAARMNLAHWALPWTLVAPSAPAPDCEQPGGVHTADPGANFVAPALWAAALVNVLGNKVLPACYGLVGAWAAVARRVSARIKSSELARRDHMICWIQLGLGAVIGGCIGLFVSPTGEDARDAAGLLGTASISFSALSFLAGYGVEHVFRSFEGVLDRVFPKPDQKHG